MRKALTLSERVLLFALVASAILMHTAIANIGDSGLPLFYATFPLAALAFAMPGSALLRIPRHNLIVCLSMVAIIVCVSALHPFFNIGEPGDELKQVISRTLYYAFLALTALVVRTFSAAERAWKWLMTGLKLTILYGFYQFIAGFVGLPLFLGFLRNSKSFIMSENYAGGWINTFRAMSIWAEPSSSAIPVAVFLLILFSYTPQRRERRRWMVLVTLFAILTFSRLTWASWLGTVFVYWTFRSRRPLLRSVADFAFRHRYVLALLLVVVLMQWAVFVPDDADPSAVNRSNTIFMGQKIFLSNVWLGSGFNSFAKLSDRVATYYADEDFVVVQNLFVSYAQQLGVLGIVLSLLPIMYVLWMDHIPAEQRLALAMAFIATGSLGGDFLYAPFAWFVLGVLAAAAPARGDVKQPLAAGVHPTPNPV